MTAFGHLEWFAGDLATGQIRYSIPVTADSWTLTLDEPGALDITLAVTDPAVAALRPYLSLEPGRAFLGVAYIDPSGGETLIEAGPVWTHGFDDEQGTVRIGGSGVWSYYDHRKVIPSLAAGQNPAQVTSSVAGLSLGSIAAHLVALAHSHTHGALPVVLPADVADTESRTYNGYELVNTGQAIRDLVATDGGPEIAFVPRRATDPTRIEWVLQVGTPTQPWLVQSGDDWVWDRSTPASSISNISVDRNGTGLASRAWVGGAGTAEGRLISVADDTTLTDGGWPLLEVEGTARDTIESASVLDGYAAQAVSTARRPVEQWTLTVKPGTWPPPGAYRPGHWAQVLIGTGHPYLPAGTFRGRIISVSGSSTGPVTVTFQPAEAAFADGSTTSLPIGGGAGAFGDGPFGDGPFGG